MKTCLKVCVFYTKPKTHWARDFENATHTVHILMWCYRDFYGGTEAGCTVIQRAK